MRDPESFGKKRKKLGLTMIHNIFQAQINWSSNFLDIWVERIDHIWSYYKEVRINYHQKAFLHIIDIGCIFCQSFRSISGLVFRILETKELHLIILIWAGYSCNGLHYRRSDNSFEKIAYELILMFNTL